MMTGGTPTSGNPHMDTRLNQATRFVFSHALLEVGTGEPEIGKEQRPLALHINSTINSSIVIVIRIVRLTISTNITY